MRGFLVLILATLGVLVMLGEQGARVGRFAFSAPSSQWLWLVGVVVFLVAPASDRPISWSLLGSLSIGLLAGGWFVYHLRTSLFDATAELAASATLTGEHGERTRSGRTDLLALETHLPFSGFLENRGRVLVEISGILFAPEQGDYRFLIDANVTGSLIIDNANVSSFAELDETSAYLSRGTHSLHLELYSPPSDGFMRLRWDRPPLFESVGLASYVATGGTGGKVASDSYFASKERLAQGSVLLGAIWWCGISYLLVRLGGRRTSVRPTLFHWARVPAERWGGLREAGGLTAVFFAVGVALAMPALSWPMAFDDLVLLRSFSSEQISDSLHGQWDPERLMNRGFRPGSLIFNHVRYGLFGEDVVAHRLFLLLLYGLYGALFVSVVARLGVDRRTAVLAVILSLCSVFSVFHYVWITDGNHMIQGLAFIVAARLLLSGLDTTSKPKMMLSVLAIFVGLITREDTFAAVPALMVMGFLLTYDRAGGRRYLFLYSGSLVLLCLALYQYRRWAVPAAAPLGHDVAGLASSIARMLHPLGNASFDGWSRAASIAWWVAVTSAIVIALRHHERSRLMRICVWFVCAVLACAPTVNLQRDNMFFFPISFAALGFAELFALVFARGRVAKVVAVLGLSAAIGGGFYVSRIFAENFHPRSLRVIWWNGRYVYGAYSSRAVIPKDRLLAVKEQLASAGIRDERLHLRHTRHLERRAIATGRRRPDAAGHLFYPLLPWGED